MTNFEFLFSCFAVEANNKISFRQDARQPIFFPETLTEIYGLRTFFYFCFSL